MRHFLVLILILCGQSSFAQWNPDTTISKRALNSLYRELSHYKDANKHAYFNSLITKYTAIVDSIYSTEKDTLTIFHLTKTNRPLLMEQIHFDRFGCKRLQFDTYYDTVGRKQYKVQWSMSCNSGDFIKSMIQYRHRYHYDVLGNEIGMTMESNDGGGHRVQRFYYTIDSDGKKVFGNTIKLNEYAFWD